MKDGEGRDEREAAILAIQCGLTLDQFWELDHNDLLLYVEAYRRKEKEKMEMLAWACANVMAPHLKRPIKPRQLLGHKTVNLLGMPEEEVMARLSGKVQ